MHMNNQDQQATGGDAAPSISVRGAARRRFARAGVGVTGALVTISSKAGMAADICTVPSGSLSGGLQSQNPASVLACDGRSPGYWKTHDGWPCSKALKFGAVFTCSPDSPYDACSLEDILEPKQWDNNGIGRHLAASYLNIQSGKINFLTERHLQRMWDSLRGQGLYQAAPGKQWDATEVVDYLKGTMG
jgi:hypothetical protein